MTAPDNAHPEQPEPVIRDKRRIDPDTGTVRDSGAGTKPEPDPAADTPVGEVPQAQAAEQLAEQAPSQEDVAALDEAAAALAAERLADLQRLQAEYVNYRKRVDRDRSLARQDAIGDVIEALMPTLDEIALARQHGDLVEGSPFAAMADKIEAGLQRFGLERFGEVGDPFDPAVHEALMHQTSAEVTAEQVSMVMQPGYKLGDKLLRAARVGVTSPE